MSIGTKNILNNQEKPASPSLMESLRDTTCGVTPSKTSATFSSDEGATDLILELFSF